MSGIIFGIAMMTGLAVGATVSVVSSVALLILVTKLEIDPKIVVCVAGILLAFLLLLYCIMAISVYQLSNPSTNGRRSISASDFWRRGTILSFCICFCIVPALSAMVWTAIARVHLWREEDQDDDGFICNATSVLCNVTSDDE